MERELKKSIVGEAAVLDGVPATERGGVGQFSESKLGESYAENLLLDDWRPSVLTDVSSFGPTLLCLLKLHPHQLPMVGASATWHVLRTFSATCCS